jgi:hypothetical protein
MLKLTLASGIVVTALALGEFHHSTHWQLFACGTKGGCQSQSNARTAGQLHATDREPMRTAWPSKPVRLAGFGQQPRRPNPPRGRHISRPGQEQALKFNEANAGIRDPNWCA